MGIKINQIIEGWKNSIVPPKELKEVITTVSRERLRICMLCPHYSKNDPKSSVLRPDVYCTKCGCTLSAKTKCLSCECPLDPPKWEKVNDTN